MTNIFDRIKPALLSGLLISFFCLTACGGGQSPNSEINDQFSAGNQGDDRTLDARVADGVITGHVYLDTTLTEEKEYWAQVTLQDVSLADGPAILVSELSLTGLSGDSFQFSLAYDAAEIDERSFYSVDIKVYIKTSTETDKLVFNNTHLVSVITWGNPTDINTELQRVKTSSNQGAIQFVDSIDEVEGETIENFKSISFTNNGDAAYGRNRMDVEFDILGGCEDSNFTLYIENTFLESNPVQVRAKLVNDIIDDCTYQQSASVSINLIPLQQRYEEAYSDRTGSIIIGDFGLYEMEVSTFRNDISYSLLSCPTDVTPTADLESILFSALGNATLHFANQLDAPLWANYDLAGQDISVNYSLPGIFFTQEFNFSMPQDSDIIVDSNGCTFAVTTSI